jgi:hypothetical protein
MSIQLVAWRDYQAISWLAVKRQNQQIYQLREGDFPRLSLSDIEAMMLLLAQNRVTHLTREECRALSTALKNFTRSLVLRRRVEDLQLGVESYQKQLNIKKPRFDFAKINEYDLYDCVHGPFGIVFPNSKGQHCLMREDELESYCDDTLNQVRTNMLKIRDQARKGDIPSKPKEWHHRVNVLSEKIQALLKKRRIMRRLEMLVGGRLPDMDVQLMKRTN